MEFGKKLSLARGKSSPKQEFKTLSTFLIGSLTVTIRISLKTLDVSLPNCYFKLNLVQNGFKAIWLCNQHVVYGDVLSYIRSKRNSPLTPDSAKSEINKFSKITNWVKLKNGRFYSTDELKRLDV